MNSGSSGTYTRAVDLPSPTTGGSVINPGSTWYFQYWYRDPQAGGANFNLTDALGGTFCP